MPPPLRFFAASAALAVCAVPTLAADSPAVETAAPLPADWIDPRTGHRVIRLSPDEGGSSLYFHQHSYTPEGDKIVIQTRAGIVAVDLTTLGVSPPKRELVAPNARVITTAFRARDAYFRRGGSLMAVNLDTRAEREVVKFPEQVARFAGATAINADETILVGIAPDPDGKTTPRLPPSGKLAPPRKGSLEPQWAAGTPKMIYTIDIKSGEFKVIHRENDWTNHLQVSPTDPQEIMFCHEGPWHYNDRTWVIRADGTGLKLLHERTMNMEIEGHEFFSPDGRMVYYDLQTPQSTVFWLAGYDLATGHRTWYNLQRDEWSVHFNVSHDGKLFAGDGGGPGSVAARYPDGTRYEGGNGQWIYLFRPSMVAGSSFRDKKELVDIGYFKSERLVDMSKHDYSKETGVEPNLTFTPDGKWIVFAGNFHSPRVNGRAVTHTYAVEIAKPEPKNVTAAHAPPSS